MSITQKKQIEDSDTVHYVSERKKRGREEAKLQPPLTPMIDVTFQLLLYFLVTSTFAKDEGQIPGTLPGGPKTPSKTRPVRIVLSPIGVHLDKVQYELSGLAPIRRVEELASVLVGQRVKYGDEVPVIIKADPNVRWEYVVEAFNAASNAKFKKIGFAPS
ncbi:MAG: biopolymer transporter ExbD [Phycisphaerae bacterium]|nr:biopolymer transporter ExbD [Phycisphaerae bacterium]